MVDLEMVAVFKSFNQVFWTLFDTNAYFKFSFCGLSSNLNLLVVCPKIPSLRYVFADLKI